MPFYEHLSIDSWFSMKYGIFKNTLILKIILCPDHQSWQLLEQCKINLESESILWVKPRLNLQQQPMARFSMFSQELILSYTYSGINKTKAYKNKTSCVLKLIWHIPRKGNFDLGKYPTISDCTVSAFRLRTLHLNHVTFCLQSNQYIVQLIF